MTVPTDTPTESAPPGAATPPAPASPRKAPSPLWPAIAEGGAALYAWLMRPRVRLTLAGALLLLVGALIASNTMWTLPLVIVGALMVAVAWIGHRLEGRFAVEWGEAGTQLAFNATIKPPQPTTETPAVSAARPVTVAELVGSTDDVIDGEAHTVEINVGELKALIAAAEAAEAVEAAEAAEPTHAAEAVTPVDVAEATAERGERHDAEVRDIRIRRLVDDGAPGPRATS